MPFKAKLELEIIYLGRGRKSFILAVKKKCMETVVSSTASLNLGCLPNYFLESEGIRAFWNERILRQFINEDRSQNTDE
jgi:hypothetical protein